MRPPAVYSQARSQASVTAVAASAAVSSAGYRASHPEISRIAMAAARCGIPVTVPRSRSRGSELTASP